jgi:hypothetical protein
LRLEVPERLVGGAAQQPQCSGRAKSSRFVYSFLVAADWERYAASRGAVFDRDLPVLGTQSLCSCRGVNDYQSLLARVGRACPLVNFRQNIKKTYQLVSRMTLHFINDYVFL